MDASYFQSVVSHLEGRGVRFESGLSDSEVRAVQEHFGFRFPPDLRAFLQFALPVAGVPKTAIHPRAIVLNDPPPFINWRVPEERVYSRLSWPLEGMCFDIEHSAFWKKEWGVRPDSLSKACSIAREAVAQAPILIPIYRHRYMPDHPHESSNPVFSVWQTDIIVYGNSLERYWLQEFGVPTSQPPLAEARSIEFWSDLL